MEALIYDESPLAGYLEPTESTTATTPFPPQYAPRGLPQVSFGDRLRQLRLTARSVASFSDGQFLERFRYVMVASQLLDDFKSRSRPTYGQTSTSITVSFNGVLFATILSFFVAWSLNWLRNRAQHTTPISWNEITLYLVVAACCGLLIGAVGRRQYQKFVRESASVAATRLITESHKFDATAGASIRYVQEVEVVARGYEMYGESRQKHNFTLTSARSHPLPPISRLEERNNSRQCAQLRVHIVDCLATGISDYVKCHNDLQSIVDSDDLRNYHDIYELTPTDLSSAVVLANELSTDAADSLKQIRMLLQVHSLARKFFLVDLLALRARPTWSDVHQWRMILQTLHALAQNVQSASQSLEHALRSEETIDPDLSDFSCDEGIVASPTHDASTLHKHHSKAQIRRFEAVANGVRSMNARVKLARNEMAELISDDAGETTLTNAVAKHYDVLGSEIRSLMVEWERGRNTMLLGTAPNERLSRASSGVRSPLSPSPSLGGLTMVDGGPAEALRLLSGEDETSNHTDEEIFEAVAKPRQRMSLALTRDEKMTKLKEDRRKRATLQEQADTTTHMLRELQMVIKHRPHQRQASRITTSP